MVCEGRARPCWSWSAHGPRCEMRLSRSPLSPVPAVVLAGSILSWAKPAAGHRATGVQMAFRSVAGTSEAQHPKRAEALIPNRLLGYDHFHITISRRSMCATCPWQSKSQSFRVVRRRRWEHTVCRRGTSGARQNLTLNPLVHRATVRACSMHLPDHPLTVNLICTARLTSTRTL